jgi:RNA polymerase sigma-70 factor (ECF subfamily)
MSLQAHCEPARTIKPEQMTVNPVYHQSDERLREELSWIKSAKKDPERFGPLYRKYHEQIFRYIHQRMDDQEMAFDVTSQVFVKAMLNLHKYEYRGVPFSSWLYRIAKSELYQAFRDRKARRTVNVDSMHIFEMIEEMEEEDTSANKQRLIDCLPLLADADLQLIEMRYFEKRSYKEIGEILDITENNAKVRAFRALERLKRLFMK